MKKSLVFYFIIWLMAGTVAGYAAPAEPTEPTESELPAPLLIKGPEQATHVDFQSMEEGKALVSVKDASEKPVLGLTADQFTITKGLRTAKILSAEPLETSKEVGLNIIMVVDNSKSMSHRKAVAPLTEALEAFYSTLRPIDRVSAVVFDEQQTVTVNDQPMRAKILQTDQVGELRDFISASLSNRALTHGTYLLDAMLVGMDLAAQMPEKANKFLVVFSDGEDINSSVSQKDVAAAARNITNFSVYAVDYMPSKKMDPFLSQMAADHSGHIWKAASAAELLPVFESFSSTLLHRYVVSYRFLDAPQGSLSFDAPELTIEEVTTIDSAPLLNHVYFETGRSELPDRYELLSGKEQTDAFSEKNLKGPMEKYRNLLNIIGRRLRDNPEATIRLVGCNANVGEEKGRTDLSRSRAKSVQAYLRYVWGIDPQRMTIEDRNLPEAPSTNRIAEGQAENQRVEIYADNAAILDTVDSEYIEKVSNLNQLKIVPNIRAEAGINDYKVDIFCGQKEIKTIQGQGDLPTEWSVPLEAALLEDISDCRSVQMQMEVTDKEANAIGKLETGILPVNFVQRTRQKTNVQEYKVKEQYALILFDYDSAAIKAHNQAIVDRIIARIQQVPDATISIVGHTDNIGSEKYNLNLSDRRARAAEQSILEAARDLADRMTVNGVGPNDPLYDNTLPEGRALNRTVTITLEYMQK